MPKVAIDAMGGDHAPDEIVQGVAQVSLETDIQCVLVGDRDRVQDLLVERSYRPERISIVHAPSVIGMEEEPKEALRSKRDASVLVGAGLVARGDADALVSAGNTGAAVLACAKSFRRLPGIEKTALATVYPRRTEYEGQDPLALLLDVGATIRCEPRDLVRFAAMGVAYARRISKVKDPRVALLNMGEEPTKGDEVLVEAYRQLERHPGIHFVGNVEGTDLAKGKADVIVTEGFTGNVVLKLIEGIAEVLQDLADHASRESVAWRFGLGLLGGGIRQLQELTDYKKYGGSPILGFENIFIKSHGRSNAQAVGNAVKVAAKAARDDVPGEIAEMIASLG